MKYGLTKDRKRLSGTCFFIPYKKFAKLKSVKHNNGNNTKLNFCNLILSFKMIDYYFSNFIQVLFPIQIVTSPL